MSYYKVTVDLYEDDADRYKSNEIYKQEVSELDLQAVIEAVNKVLKTQRLGTETLTEEQMNELLGKPEQYES